MRTRRSARHSLGWGLVLAAVVAAIVWRVTGPMHMALADALDAPDASGLVEASTCAEAPAPATAPPQPAPAPASSDVSVTTITVTIGPMTWVRLDGAGRPTQALTNTGCAPRPSDTFVLDGGTVALTETAAAVVNCVRGGDWTQATWVALDCGG